MVGIKTQCKLQTHSAMYSSYSTLIFWASYEFLVLSLMLFFRRVCMLTATCIAWTFATSLPLDKDLFYIGTPQPVKLEVSAGRTVETSAEKAQWWMIQWPQHSQLLQYSFQGLSKSNLSASTHYHFFCLSGKWVEGTFELDLKSIVTSNLYVPK